MRTAPARHFGAPRVRRRYGRAVPTDWLPHSDRRLAPLLPEPHSGSRAREYQIVVVFRNRSRTLETSLRGFKMRVRGYPHADSPATSKRLRRALRPHAPRRLSRLAADPRPPPPRTSTSYLHSPQSRTPPSCARPPPARTSHLRPTTEHRQNRTHVLTAELAVRLALSGGAHGEIAAVLPAVTPLGGEGPGWRGLLRVSGLR